MDKHSKLGEVNKLMFKYPIIFTIGIKEKGKKEIEFKKIEFRTPGQMIGFINTMLINIVHALLSADTISKAELPEVTSK